MKKGYNKRREAPILVQRNKSEIKIEIDRNSDKKISGVRAKERTARAEVKEGTGLSMLLALISVIKEGKEKDDDSKS